MKTRTIFSIIVLVAFAVTKGRAQELTGFSEKGKWGFKNAQGAVVVKSVYDTVYSFSDGMARVRNKSGKKHMYGYVNATGKEVVKPKYIAATDFEDGVAIVAEGMVNLNTIAEMQAAGAQMFGTANQMAQASVGISRAAAAMSNIQVAGTGGASAKDQQQVQRVDQRNAQIQQQLNADFQNAMAASAAGNKAAATILQNSWAVPELGMIDKAGKELVRSKKSRHAIIEKLDVASSNWYLIAKSVSMGWGGVPLFWYIVYDADKKTDVIPQKSHYIQFDAEVFAEKEWFVVAVSKASLKDKMKYRYGVIDYAGKVVIPTEHDIFDPAMFAPHERILVGDILKRENTGNIYLTPTITEATYGVINHAGKVIIPKMECTGIELTDNLFVTTDANGSKRYFDLDGKEIMQ